MAKKTDKKAAVKDTTATQDPLAAKAEALGNALANIEKQFGKGAIRQHGHTRRYHGDTEY